ncbi:TlpA disulfide reductase family protein [Shewanella sp. 1_MG-2023]|jgi:thiol-disulfide isomerase/thioredoxin|uniref:TlpA disulfide reductase family protein n=1 Tax=unclassified Shewanella TaxID=196818 RepID=UPI000C84FF67|nr:MULTISPECIES: TlpA disulfide reductase family protein [unclassified Shewanella]MDO6612022.1 TlpA disulfide reductase family protein [Shewanella sp. 7_MG-2023]MDO6771902.1 TlpA disulfide reductase family protein [Shewanella sp. 2_MG-2023]MDO6794246.1 TlpA disulfide reductase family protein [Shewanella sp. 1_MG-2023]PMG78627.1 redoxin [Shewanella sp. 10N.286.51.B7]
MKMIIGILLLIAPLIASAAPSLNHLVEDVEGNKVSLSEFKGKVVYVDFWSSWCGPCRKSFPWMNQMHEQYQQQGLAVVAINLDVEVELAQVFLEQLPAQFTIRYDPESEVARLFGLKGMPSSFIFNRQGELVQQHTGFNLEQTSQYEQELVNLLEQ